jgi:hypothetical protein
MEKARPLKESKPVSGQYQRGFRGNIAPRTTQTQTQQRRGVVPTALPYVAAATSPLPIALMMAALTNASANTSYSASNAVPEGNVEVLSTPIGGLSIKRDYIINTTLLVGGLLLILFGIGGLIWGGRKEIVKTAVKTAIGTATGD